MTEALFTTAELSAIEDRWYEARRLIMHHDDAFYGPVKGAKCGCDYCKWPRRYVELARTILSARHERAGVGS